MRTPTRVLACLALLAAWAATAAAASVAGPAATPRDIVRLKDGTLVHGEITDFDEASGFTLVRADTGGRLPLRWEHLPAAEVTRIKASRGFTGEEPEPFMVQVVHLVLRNGTTETGVLVESDEESFTLRRRSGTDRVPRSSVRGVETGLQEGRTLYRPDELYGLVRADVGEPEDALGHFNLAVACEGAGLHEQAASHYASVTELDPGFKRELIASRQQRLAVKLEDAEETEELDAIRFRLYRRQYEQALELVDVFRETYPTSRQMGDVDRLEAEIRQRKRGAHARSIVGDYFTLLERRLLELARDREVTLDVAEESAERFVHEDILATLARAYELTPETCAELWDTRSGGSVRSYSYGTGTFILGRDKALDFGRVGEEDDPLALDDEGALEDEAFEDLVERVKRERAAEAAEAQARRSGGGALDETGPSPEEWWANAPTDDRFKWLMAYYAEFADAVQVTEARGRACRICTGLGYLDGTNQDGEPMRVLCHTCKGLEAERLVRFR